MARVPHGSLGHFTFMELSSRMNANAIYAVKHRCEEMLLCEARAIREAWEQLRLSPPH